MMWIWATLVLIHSNTTRSKIWALGFPTIDKMFCKNANQFICSDLLLANCHESPTWKEYDFFPYKVVISLLAKILVNFWENIEENFGKMFYSRINSTNFAIWGGGGGIHQFSYGKNWKTNPDMRDIHGKLNSNSPNSKNSKSQFLNDKYQWVTK
jgi:hypothetical protein